MGCEAAFNTSKQSETNGNLEQKINDDYNEAHGEDNTHTRLL